MYSGVIFALKVITSELLPSNVNVMGIHIPARWACWVELFLIQLLVPNASFIGIFVEFIIGAKSCILFLLVFTCVTVHMYVCACGYVNVRMYVCV